MRRPRNIRHLGQREKDIAKKVFKNTIPYDDVVVSDGLGGGDRPFTVPTSMPVTVLFNVSDGKYVMHVGEGYTGMSYRQVDQNLLIHELAHVWQGEHSSSSWNYVFSSMWHQALSADAYDYDKRRWKHWDDYNPEQQAQIVEDWFAAGMNEAEDYDSRDTRFYYIKKHIRGESILEDWTLPVVRPLPKATLHVELPGESPDPYLLPILKTRFDANDVSGFGGRVKKVEEIFKKLRPVDAHILLRRLEARRNGDKVAQYFHEHLSTASRNALMKILKER